MSQQSGLTAYTLRCYERIGLLKPIPRNQSSAHRLLFRTMRKEASMMLLNGHEILTATVGIAWGLVRRADRCGRMAG